jgi:hypothetical protein
MSALEKGITASGTGYAGKQWNILGQVFGAEDAFARGALIDVGGEQSVFIATTQGTRSLTVVARYKISSDAVCN